MQTDPIIMRRHFLRQGAVMLLGLTGASLLSGCGFELRKAPVFAFESIVVPGKSPYLVQLRRALGVAGTVRVLSEAPLPPDEQADVVFELVNELRDRTVLSTTSAGQVREVELRLRIQFKLHTPQGRDIIPVAELAQSRDISFNETAALAKEGEEQLLYRDMTSDLVQQTLRRLAAVKTL